MKQSAVSLSKRFSGFPARMQFTPVPNLFFSSLLPQIDDIDELKITLHIIRAVYTKKGNIRFVTISELLNDKALLSGFKEAKPAEALKSALDMAVKRGTILYLSLAQEGNSEDVYFVNTENTRGLVDKIKNGEMSLSGLKAGGQSRPEINTEPVPNIFTLYEQNIGMLTPMIADELREAEKLYPEDWIREAIKEAVSLNKRNWRYIERILENWSTEGRVDGTYRRDSKTSLDKFSQQKYGHMVQR